MALYDRDYAREDDSSFGSWAAGKVTIWLITAIVGIFIVQVLTKPPFQPAAADKLMEFGAFNLSLVLDGEVWRVFTAAWLHNSSNLLPIVVGMIMLYFFGKGIEDDLGGIELLCFYLAAVVFTQVVEFLARFTGLENPRAFSYGSIGPITAVMVLYACRHPREIVRLFFVLPVPMWSVAVGTVILTLLGFFTGGASRGEPALPLAGAAFAGIYWQLNLRFAGYLPVKHRRPQLRIVPRDDDEDDDSPPVAIFPRRREPSLDEHLEAKMDQVLEKLARSGKDSLTAEENEVLRQAGEAIRRNKK